MKKIYLITYRDGLKKAYLSKNALYADNSHKDMGISKFTLQNFDFSLESFENEFIKIELLIARAKSEIEPEKEKFL